MREREEKRIVQYEMIRVIAMLFVVAIHVLHELDRNTPQRVFCYYVLTLLFVTCNGLFYFLSGKFALQKVCDSKEEYFQYYAKKIQNVIIPIFFYMILRSAYDADWKVFQWEFWKQCADNILSGYALNEYWFLYVLVGALLIAPFMSRFFVNAKKHELYIFLAFGLFWNSCATYLPYLNRNLSWNYVFQGWIFYFFSGVYMEKLVDSKGKKRLLIFLGAISFVITIIQKYAGFKNHVHDLAPTYFFIASALFILLRELYIPDWKWLRSAIYFIGKNSFSVYMIHMSVIPFVLKQITISSYLGRLIAVTIITVMISLGIGVFLNCTVLKIIQNIFQRIARCKTR